MADDYLEHYGVLGMHWGVRKDGGPQGYNGTYPKGSRTGRKVVSKNQNGRKTYSGRDPEKQAAKKDANQARRRRFTMSDKELDDRINRLKKQKQLKDLTDEEYNDGKKYVVDVLKKAGKIVLPATVAAAALAFAQTMANQSVAPEDRSPVNPVQVMRNTVNLAKKK